MSLVEVTKDTRVVLKIAAVLAVVVFVIFGIFKGGQFLKSTFFPDPPPPAEKKFGLLPEITFPEENSQEYSYSIETISGFLPTFQPTISVYKLKQNEPTITALPDARIKAASAGFTDNETAISSSEYEWTNPGLGTSLLYGIYSANFEVKPNFSDSLTLFPTDTLTNDDITRTITSFTTSLGANTEDIDFEKSKLSYFTKTPDGISSVNNASLATLTKVNLFQKPVNEVPIYYPSPNESILYFTLGLTGGPQPVVLEASYNHFTPNLTESSTYDLKTAQEAYDDLKKGKGFVVAPTESKSVGITDIQIGYYLDNSQQQEYLQPIIVFSGTNDFKAYVSAVKD